MCALSTPRPIFGITSVMAYNRSSYIPYGVVRVTGGGDINLTANRVDLFGGSNKFPWASEATTIDSEFSFTVREFPDFLIELFLGTTASTTAAEASGGVTALTNLVGSGVFHATTGIASAAITTTADAKYGRYVILVTDAANDLVDIYFQSIVDQNRGADLTFQDDTLLATASDLTIPGSSGTVAIPNTGVTLTGGSGTIDLGDDNDVAYFDVRPPHSGQSIMKVGASGTTFTDFGARMTAAKTSANEIFEIHAWKCNGAGMPLSLTENEYAEAELSLKMLYDSTQDGVFEIIAIDET